MSKQSHNLYKGIRKVEMYNAIFNGDQSRAEASLFQNFRCQID